MNKTALSGTVACVLALLTPTPAPAQPLTIYTLAGFAGRGNTDGVGGQARFYHPNQVAVDSTGTIYVADTENHTIRKITAAGAVSTLAGMPGLSGSADGAGNSARFCQPTGVAVDTTGNVYVADSGNHTTRKITPAGGVSTLAGLAGIYGSADGTNATARFWLPGGVAVSGTSNVTVYVADTGNSTIRHLVQVGTEWWADTLAGSAATGSADGPGADARFDWPAGIAADSAGNVHLADTANHTIRKIGVDGHVSTLAGSPGFTGSADGAGPNARFSGPQGIAVDTAGNLYIADTLNATIRKLTPAGVVSTLAGLAGNYGMADGVGSNARFDQPEGVAVDGAGHVYVADTLNHTIRKVTPAGIVSTVAGLAGNFGSADGTNSRARFHRPTGVAVDAGGTIFVTDSLNHTIRSITPGGEVKTLAGLAGVSGNADGTNAAARFFQPHGLVVTAAGDLYVADSGNQTIRKVSAFGTNWVVTTVAGGVGGCGSTDGTGSGARFCFPAGLALDGAGRLYVADAGNHTVRTDRFVPPTLQFWVAGDQLVLHWPVSAIGFVLECSSSLIGGAVWLPLTNGVVTWGDRFVLTNSLDRTASFYRLHRP